jgi:hypothetical protein
MGNTGNFHEHFSSWGFKKTQASGAGSKLSLPKIWVIIYDRANLGKKAVFCFLFSVFSWGALTLNFEPKTSAKSLFVILSEAKDLVFTRNFEILRSLRSLRMTVERIFAELSTLNFMNFSKQQPEKRT